MFDPSTSLFAGMDRAALQAALSSAQQAYIALSSGEKEVTASYTQGDGARSVTFTQTDVAKLTTLIRQLQQQLGIVCRARRPLRFLYR